MTHKLKSLRTWKISKNHLKLWLTWQINKIYLFNKVPNNSIILINDLLVKIIKNMIDKQTCLK